MNICIFYSTTKQSILFNHEMTSSTKQKAERRELLLKFINSFVKAIGSEMDAMRRRLGPYEVSLAEGKKLTVDSDEKEFHAQYKMLEKSDKLILNSECVLRVDKKEFTVTILDISEMMITLSAVDRIPVSGRDLKLVIYPWFLYERLIDTLEALPDQPTHFVDNALRLFGKIETTHQRTPLCLDHSTLNSSQLAAVQLCSDNDLSFVWGPPGTGKTTTLARIVLELLSQGKRVLVTSTTNAAVDQALQSLACAEESKSYLDEGRILRFGQMEGETHGASLAEVTYKRYEQDFIRLEDLKIRGQDYKKLVKKCDSVIKALLKNKTARQLNLFGGDSQTDLAVSKLSPIFGENRALSILDLPPEDRMRVITDRRDRIQRCQELIEQKKRKIANRLKRLEWAAIRSADVVLSTMTNVYISSFLVDERFDAVIVEEAGMAVLPTLFYCGTLSRDKVIIIGDPKQLPPIVQSDDTYAKKAMGRSIFDVTLTENDEDKVVLLDTQYRMHPRIGKLVSQLFYDDRLKNGDNTSARQQIADMAPFSGDSIILVDTEEETICQTQEGGYSRYNEQTVRLGVDLAKLAVQSGIDSVAIITPYVAQARLYRQMIGGLSRYNGMVECSTVHRFQGGERDLVILDTVDTSPLSPGILLTGHRPGSQAENLLNVAVSRARGKLIVIADVSYFEKKAPVSAMVKTLRMVVANGNRVSFRQSLTSF